MNPFNPCRTTAASLALALPLLLNACASAPVPVELMAVAEAAVQRASTASTGESAPAELRLANAKLAEARSAIKAGDTERGRRLAVEATVDAEAAEMRAQAERSSKAARDSEDAARVLREELSRKTTK